MKKIILILTLFLIIINPSFAAATVKKDVVAQSVDGFTIKATLEFPKDKTTKEFSTVVLLHSLGYSSEWWDNLPQELLDNGYAVLSIDLRGHGKSIYNAKLIKTSWKGITNAGYAKYPEDVISVINKVKDENTKKEFFKNWAIVGADIGGNAGILAAEALENKPKSIVLLSPVVSTRGLYIPVKLAHLTNVDILSISGKDDFTSINAEKYLQKFAQATFVTYTSDVKSTGMLMLKNDKSLSKIISTWLKSYL